MDEKELKNYLKAGKILKEVREKAEKSIRPGQKLIEIAEKIEKNILSLHGKPAFPVNLSLNNYAAHYSPSAGDSTALGESDALKVDIGVHIEGYVADCAFTLNFSGEHSKMINAAEEALENAVKTVKEGTKLEKIGEKIEKTIRGKGFNPIQNLSGHGLMQWVTHAPPSIPNISKKDDRELEDGMAFAIEPFATDGRGYVREGVQAEIFQLDEPRAVRSRGARKIIEFVAENYHTLPFAERWIIREMKLSDFERKTALRELLQRKCIKAFPILHEEQGRIVAQAESTLILNKGKVIRLV